MAMEAAFTKGMGTWQSLILIFTVIKG